MLRAGHVVALCVLALLCLGVVMVNSADMTVHSGAAVTFESVVTSRSSKYMALALLGMIGAAIVGARLWPRVEGVGGGYEESGSANRSTLGFGRDGLASRPTLLHPRFVLAIGALLVLLLLVYAPVLGREVKGSARWIRVPFFESFQPSEVVKWTLPFLLALYAAWQGSDRMRRFDRLFVAFGAAGLLSAVVAVEDLGTGVLMMGTSTVVLIAGGVSPLKLSLFVPPALGALTLAVFTSEYRLRRITSFLDPFGDPADAGYHMIQSMAAVANGEVFGRGLGFGLQKFGYLPEDRTDFIFAVICEELGVMGAAIVVALYLALLWAAFSIAMRIPARAAAARLFALGAAATVGFQAIINIGVVTGLGPTKGIALPLLSSGGTGWIFTAASMGLLIALDYVYAPPPAPEVVDGAAYEADEPPMFAHGAHAS